MATFTPQSKSSDATLTKINKTSSATFSSTTKTAIFLWAATTFPWLLVLPWQTDGSGVDWDTINKN